MMSLTGWSGGEGEEVHASSPTPHTREDPAIQGPRRDDDKGTGRWEGRGARGRRRGDVGDSSLFHAAFRLAGGRTGGVIQEGGRRPGGEIAAQPRIDAGTRHTPRGE